MNRGIGSVFQQVKNGKRVWQVEVTIGHKPNGKRIAHRRTVHSYAEARKIQAKLVSKLHNGELAPRGKETLESFAIWWLRTAKAPTIRPSTAGDYEFRYRRYIQNVFGNQRLDQIGSRAIANWMLDLSSEGYSIDTINGARQVLQMILEGAVTFGHLATNPARAVPKHKKTFTPEQQARRTWNRAEAQRALAASAGTEMELPIHFGVVMGMRRSEILGLKWEDFDFANGSLRIRRGIREVRTYDSEGVARVVRGSYPPKNASSARKLNIGALVNNAILNHRSRQEALGHYDPEGWVFTNTRGAPLSPSGLHTRWEKFRKTNDIPRVRFHDMRHSAAELSLEGKARLEAVSQYLGHSRVDTTKSIYAPFVEALNVEFSHAIENLLLEPQTYIEVAHKEAGGA